MKVPQFLRLFMTLMSSKSNIRFVVLLNDRAYYVYRSVWQALRTRVYIKVAVRDEVMQLTALDLKTSNEPLDNTVSNLP